MLGGPEIEDSRLDLAPPVPTVLSDLDRHVRPLRRARLLHSAPQSETDCRYPVVISDQSEPQMSAVTADPARPIELDATDHQNRVRVPRAEWRQMVEPLQ
jgi:hypothetical protein